ncbi:MAG: class I SAM-dependent methyltransferase [Hyphomicrobiaceae bacterium]
MSGSGDDSWRDTRLAQLLRARIARDGPIPVADYMAACLGHPEHGYYRAREAIGATGDFVTAPEISQIFGELMGLWSAVVWQQMGQPLPFDLVELGPGRGTMMADALRAARRVPGFIEAARVRLVEPSPVLAAQQKAKLEGAARDMAWCDGVETIGAGPVIVLANEMLDVLPVRQLIRVEDGWRERGVGCDADGRLVFAELAVADVPALPPETMAARPGDIVELRSVAALALELSRIASGGPLVALLVDYGHSESGLGDTLQAVRAHAYEHPLASPGEADLTAQVDFATVAAAFRGAGFAVSPPITQAELLGSLGIAERASRLMAANPARAGEIETAVARLMAPQGMGTRFKALAIRSPGLPPPPAFQ